jgi:hypothetical protein
MALQRYKNQETGEIVLSFDEMPGFERLSVYGVGVVHASNSYMLEDPILDSILSLDALDAQLRAEERMDKEIAIFQDIRTKI